MEQNQVQEFLDTLRYRNQGIERPQNDTQEFLNKLYNLMYEYRAEIKPYDAGFSDNNDGMTIIVRGESTIFENVFSITAFDIEQKLQK